MSFPSTANFPDTLTEVFIVRAALSYTTAAAIRVFTTSLRSAGLWDKTRIFPMVGGSITGAAKCIQYGDNYDADWQGPIGQIVVGYTGVSNIGTGNGMFTWGGEAPNHNYIYSRTANPTPTGNADLCGGINQGKLHRNGIFLEGYECSDDVISLDVGGNFLRHLAVFSDGVTSYVYHNGAVATADWQGGQTTGFDFALFGCDNIIENQAVMEVAGCSFGNGLTLAEMNTLASLFQTLNTTLGRAV